MLCNLALGNMLIYLALEIAWLVALASGTAPATAAAGDGLIAYVPPKQLYYSAYGPALAVPYGATVLLYMLWCAPRYDRSSSRRRPSRDLPCAWQVRAPYGNSPHTLAPYGRYVLHYYYFSSREALNKNYSVIFDRQKNLKCAHHALVT